MNTQTPPKPAPATYEEMIRETARVLFNAGRLHDGARLSTVPAADAPREELTPTADQAAQAPETSPPAKSKAKAKAKPPVKAAAAAKKSKGKASDGGRAAAGGKGKTIACSTADAPAVRCDRTMDLIDQTFPELAASAATAGAAETLS